MSKTTKRLPLGLFNADDPALQPPEELKALCGLSDIRIEYVRGRPARTWMLTNPKNPFKSSITLQSVQYEDWAEAVKTLIT